MKKAALTVAGLALALSALAGCGDDSDDGGSTNASKDDFCANFESLKKDLSGLSDDDIAEGVDTLKDAADKMEDTGTPEDIPDDAREGFENILNTIDDLDDDASAADLMKLGEGQSEADEANTEAFNKYLQDTCDIS